MSLPELPDLSGIPDHKEEMVRRMLDGPHPPVPPDLGARAAARGKRAVARRRMLRVLLLVLAGAAVGALLLWAVATQPWSPPESTTPPVGGL
ncbi:MULTISPECIES: hypothetical protein [Streptomyces]|uniref:Uncharacterized protein n=2 Tax=Streptomyces TaxID=1883 RepID=A0A3M8EVH2_9ACTN|nr:MULTISPECIES: hypothetical protein [Streptomyces]KNE83713.1 hypothetical protein ADZ36_03595 [Streptomyces fradiae]OFA51143.1 hypothetical protein BEN35_14465 [Streptomyces fradiae]PQM20241.1 hypothetical protein Sfr7A_27745 [Streptomyces xinghaiensis]RKM93988.1 hypothetical protein SFRA_019420 [Streptomyces xinghaiensis]RNC69491.1 hypothetical protein DC095_029420 [Streptomyces xinghaiensis]